MAAQARSSGFGRLSRFTVFLFTVTRHKGQFAYSMILSFIFYAAHADAELFLGLFWPFLAVLWCFCSFLQEKNVKRHILGWKYTLYSSFRVIGARSAALAWLKKKKERKKERKNLNNPAFDTLPSSLPCARLLTLLVVLSGSAGSPKHVYSLRMPEKACFTKFWRVYYFCLSTRVTGRFPIFRLIPTYEVLAYFMIR